MRDVQAYRAGVAATLDQLRQVRTATEREAPSSPDLAYWGLALDFGVRVFEVLHEWSGRAERRLKELRPHALLGIAEVLEAGEGNHVFLNALGARGIGEIGMAGIAAAITHAVHHATGVRVWELPVEIEDLPGHAAAGLARISTDPRGTRHPLDTYSRDAGLFSARRAAAILGYAVTAGPH